MSLMTPPGDTREPDVLRPFHFTGGDPAPSRRQRTGSSILEEDSIEEYGRTYHSYNQGTYLLPNDGQEQERLDIQHKAITTLLNGRLALAPLEEPKYALDIATGTGIWALEFARQFPNCMVYGNDLSLIQPTRLVSNCQFVKEDAEKDEWLYPQPFDYIHLRLIFTTFDDFDLVIRKIHHHLKPGGWVEFQDYMAEVLSADGSSIGTAMEKLGVVINRGLAARGRDPRRIKNLRARLERAGFVDITQHQLQFPIGGQPQPPHYKATTGMWMAHNVYLGLESITKILMAAGLSQAESTTLKTEVKAELESGRVHAYAPFYVIFARRPPQTL